MSWAATVTRGHAGDSRGPASGAQGGAGWLPAPPGRGLAYEAAGLLGGALPATNARGHRLTRPKVPVSANSVST
jgi:hypothetical protein